MLSDLPKSLHLLAGKPMLKHVMDTAAGLPSAELHVVVAPGAEHYFADCLKDSDIGVVRQSHPGGTGHAVQEALATGIAAEGRLLVLYGDVPLIELDTLQQLLAATDHNELALLTAELADSTGYGRVIRDGHGKVQAIVEEADANDQQRQIREVSTGILVLPLSRAQDWLSRLSTDNAQGELYLTDVVALARADGVAITAHRLAAAEAWQVQGVNTQAQLATAERCYQLQQARRLMAQGVWLGDPHRIDVRGELQVGRSVSIDINFIAEGRVSLGSEVSIGANCVIADSVIGDNVVIKPYSHLSGAVLGNGVTVGPYARIRPGTKLANGANIGNFVETKNAVIAEDSKVNHLSYVGDAELGRDVNVGAGVITCNYDGERKHVTTIGDRAFIGSNTALVAPLRIGAGAKTAAGSAITEDVPADTVSFGRARQVNKPAKKGGEG